MKKLFFCIALFVTQHLRAQNYWQQEVNYRIDVSLNDIEHSVKGFERIIYKNNSPDTLYYVWFHLWQNAYKNDLTAFSDQLLENNRTDFYFSNKDQKGYINQLDFRIDGMIANTEDHPQYIDIIKVILPTPLKPKDSIEITTPFYEKLPFNFSRGGHVGQSYQLTQWYPKPAVYDQKGWHPMPYLDQGEFYSEFGKYDVRITIPKNYVVAATGKLQDQNEIKWMINRKYIPTSTKKDRPSFIQKKPTKKKQAPRPTPATPYTATKTLQYIQNSVHDFAWFADKTFTVNYDTVQLSSGKIIDAFSYYLADGTEIWQKSVADIKDAIHFYSAAVGEYPYEVVSVVEARSGAPGGMEYPTIATITPIENDKELDMLICHEVGHNWFYAALGSNERRSPWLDEGINTYYERKYETWKYNSPAPPTGWLKKKFPQDWNQLWLSVLEKEKKDQPISTSSEAFSETNYDLIPYEKTAHWLRTAEESFGQKAFDSTMKNYFQRWQFKHPARQDLKSAMETTSGKNLDALFELLDKKGPLNPTIHAKKIKPAFLFSLKDRDKFNYINIGPAAGYNMYDKFMVGGIINNYNLPPDNLEFILVPLYATQSKSLKGIGDIKYSWYPESHFSKISLGISGSAFSTNAATDTNGTKIFENFSKLVPYLRFDFKNKTERSTSERWIDFRAFIIREKTFDKYVFSNVDSNLHPTAITKSDRYLNQLTLNISDNRILYPYKLQLQFQQSDKFYRINFTGNYFFNYDNNGGMNVRLFAAKFGTWNNVNAGTLTRYQPKLLGTTGEEDYTYGNYFLGRTASYAVEDASIKNDGLAAQQIMIRDGGLKMRIDQYDFLQGRSENWVAALNFNSTLPNHLFPVKLPIRLFFDVGTYAESWKSNAITSRFLYVGGVQLSLFKNVLNIYLPIVYSSDFRDQLKTIPTQNTFWKRITFSIDIQNINSGKFLRHLAFHND